MFIFILIFTFIFIFIITMMRFLNELHLQLGSYLFIASPPTTGSMSSHTSRWPPTSADASSSNRTISFHSIEMLQATWCLIWCNTPKKRQEKRILRKGALMCRQKGCNFYSIYISPFARTWSFHFICCCRCFCVCFSWKNIIHGPLFFYHKNTSHHLCGQKDGIILWDKKPCYLPFMTGSIELNGLLKFYYIPQ